MANKLEKEGLDKAGNAAAHEINESFNAGKDNPGGGYEGYNPAHTKANDSDDYKIEWETKTRKNSTTGVTDVNAETSTKKVKITDNSAKSKANNFKKP